MSDILYLHPMHIKNNMEGSGVFMGKSHDSGVV